MQIKVKDTRMHNIVLFETSAGTREKNIPITDAKLVLGGGIKPQYYDTCLPSERAQYLKPILISETEKIEEGELCLLSNSNIIKYEGDQGLRHTLNPKKILALPEHFSPKHLQAIVDGKMKDGDKVLVECGVLWPNVISSGGLYEYRIKLNSSNHITLHKVEEKNNPYNLEIGKQYWFQYTGCKSEWFHGIVTHFTQFGHPWVEGTGKSRHNGIISPGLYKVQHVSLPPPVEEKMYTREEVKKIAFGCIHISDEPTFNKWFELNVK